MEMFKVIIAGGRDFKDYRRLKSYCKHVLQNQSNVEVVSGTADGADSLGEDFAIEFKLGLKSFPAHWNDIEGKPENQIGTRRDGKKYWKVAGHVRNTQMADYADALIAFWDGKSTGTKNMIDTAKKKGLKVLVYRYE